MPKIDPDTVPVKSGSIYPAPYGAQMAGRSSLRWGQAGGLTQFGVNIVRLEPAGMSSLRHYHMQQDEFAIMLSGTCVLIEDDGEYEMQPGDCAAWPAGEANGHHLVNKTDAPATFLVVGTRTPTETCIYSDLDMMVKDDGNTFTRKDGSPLTADQIGDDND
jgi:uncharacterized cupin superfamily protein